MVAHLLVMRTSQLPFPMPHKSRGLNILAIHVLVVTFITNPENSLVAQGWVLGAAVVLFVHYCVTMGNAICWALGVNFFTIKVAKAAAKRD